jgi:hypothetical protein
MQKFRLAQTSVKWPLKCAACCSAAQRTCIADCSVLNGVDYFLPGPKPIARFEIRYPVCNRHAITSTLASFIYARNMLNIAFSLLLIILILALISMSYFYFFGATRNLDLFLFLKLSFLAVAGMGIAVLGKKFTPVKINTFDKNTVTLSIRNDDFASEFAKLNQASIIKMLSHWQT